MKTELISKYRCKCGKLLFKGNIIFSFIETKCKRCGSMNFFQDKEESNFSFSITIDSTGKIIDTCRLVSLLGKSREYLLGKNIKDFFPFIDDWKKEDFTRTINDFSFWNGGEKKLIESYVFPISENGKFKGWQIFNKSLKER